MIPRKGKPPKAKLLETTPDGPVFYRNHYQVLNDDFYPIGVIFYVTRAGYIWRPEHGKRYIYQQKWVAVNKAQEIVGIGKNRYEAAKLLREEQN